MGLPIEIRAAYVPDSLLRRSASPRYREGLKTTLDGEYYAEEVAEGLSILSDARKSRVTQP